MTSLDRTGAAYVAGNFAPLMNEGTAFDLEIIGRIREGLNGRLFRIGPNPVDEPDPIWQRSVNTNVAMIARKLCAVVESGNDPITGEQHALADEPGQPVRYISVSREGRATTKARIDLPHIPTI
jgi:carotenoid cleavage dioxygenase